MGLQFTLEEVDEAPPIVDGQEFFAICREIKGIERKSFDDPNVMEPALLWKFEIVDTDGPHDRQWVWGRTSQVFSTSSKCKLRNWAVALLGKDLPGGYNLDLDDLLDQECKLIMSVRPPAMAGRDPFVNVAEVLPLGPIEAISDESPF